MTVPRLPMDRTRCLGNHCQVSVRDVCWRAADLTNTVEGYSRYASYDDFSRVRDTASTSVLGTSKIGPCKMRLDIPGNSD